MKLRENPKRKTIYDAVLTESRENRNMKRSKQVRYRRQVKKQAAIDANMIQLLTIAKSKNPAIHLAFWIENLRSDYPVIEIRKSNLIKGGLGVFATKNCLFLPRGLIYAPNCNDGPHSEPAEASNPMYLYQFAISQGGRTSYLFPTLDPDPTLPCAQFINTPLRKSQGTYKDNVKEKCHQAMHINNAKLLGKYPGGFIGIKTIYPGFEILGSYMSSYHLPTSMDYRDNKDFNDQWLSETQKAIDEEKERISIFKNKKKEKIQYWLRYARRNNCKLVPNDVIISFENL